MDGGEEMAGEGGGWETKIGLLALSIGSLPARDAVWPCAPPLPLHLHSLCTSTPFAPPLHLSPTRNSRKWKNSLDFLGIALIIEGHHFRNS